jgi:hypothetical protein
MAACPECGGHLNPAQLLSDMSGAMTCRWCRAEIELHPAARLARNAVFFGGGTLLIAACTILYIRSDDLIWAVVCTAGLLAATIVTAAFLHFTPLLVVVPRGARKPWSRPARHRPPRS